MLFTAQGRHMGTAFAGSLSLTTLEFWHCAFWCPMQQWIHFLHSTIMAFVYRQQIV